VTAKFGLKLPAKVAFDAVDSVADCSNRVLELLARDPEAFRPIRHLMWLLEADAAAVRFSLVRSVVHRFLHG
jgi:hypothetical protein